MNETEVNSKIEELLVSDKKVAGILILHKIQIMVTKKYQCDITYRVWKNSEAVS